MYLSITKKKKKKEKSFLNIKFAWLSVSIVIEDQISIYFLPISII